MKKGEDHGSEPHPLEHGRQVVHQVILVNVGQPLATEIGDEIVRALVLHLGRHYSLL